MAAVNDNTLLEYLVENLDSSLSSKYPTKTLLALDYCFKSSERIPQDWLSGIASRVNDKRVNNSSRNISFDNRTLSDCLFLESYKSLLSDKTKNLVSSARTAQDFKALIVLDLLCTRVSQNDPVLRSSGSIASKVSSMAKKYNDSGLDAQAFKEYNELRDYCFKVRGDLKRPFSKELAQRLNTYNRFLEDKYLRHPNSSGHRQSHDIKVLARDTKSLISKKFSDHISKIDESYQMLKREFEDHVWDNERRINRLMFLSSEAEELKEKYDQALNREGVSKCETLKSRISDISGRYCYTKDLEEEIKEIKRAVSAYSKDFSSLSLDNIKPSDIDRINSMYSELKKVSSKTFPEYISPEKQEEYCSQAESLMGQMRYKCSDRVSHILEKCSKYRERVDKSFLSLFTKKYLEELKRYDNELKEWSRCQVISKS